MPDILSIIAGTLQLVDTVVKARDYAKDFRDGPKDQQELWSELQNLKPLLEEFRNRLEGRTSLEFAGIQQFERPLVRLREMAEQLTKKLDSGRGAKIYDRLTWPLWAKKEIHEGLTAIERFKTLFIAWLEMDIWDATQKQGEGHHAVLEVIKNNAADQSNKHRVIISSVENVVELQREGHTTLEAVKATVETQGISQDAKQREEIIEWWSPINFFQRHADIFGARQTGTGEWFLSNEKFKTWSEESGEILWCPGMPGAGKTVLAAIVVDYLRQNIPGNVGVAAIYLNHKESELQSPSNLLASLWRQLVFRKPLSPEVHRLYAEHREPSTRPSLEDFYRILCSTVAEYSKVFIVVDALDEYPEEKRNVLLAKLGMLETTVNILLTSRPNVNIDTVFSTVTSLQVQAAESDLRQYVEARIRESPRLAKHLRASPKLGVEIEEVILRRSEGMFLLAKLHIDSLTNKHTVKAVRDALHAMPRDLKGTYDEIMERIQRQNEEDRMLALSTLCWVSNAKRPLSIFELKVALAIDPGATEFDVDNMVEIDIIISVCAGLVIVDGTFDHGYNHVRLVHHTAQIYLDQIQATHFPHAQTQITMACITYMTMPSHRHTLRTGLMPTVPFLYYAERNLLLHARGQPELDMTDAIVRFLQQATSSNIPNPRGGLYRPLEIAIASNLDHISRHLICSEGGGDVAAILERIGYGYALHAAAAAGGLEMTSLLLDHGANVNIQEGRYSTALQTASVHGQAEVVKLLVTRGADVNLRGRGERYHATALREAWTRGFKIIVDFLVENGAEMHTQNIDADLRRASEVGDAVVVRMLISKGADTNAPEGHIIGTALQAAAANAHIEVIRILLENAADVNAQGGCYGTALQAASLHGHSRVVRLLIKKGADVNIQRGDYYGTALEAASAHGHTRVVGLLICNGADVNVPGGPSGAAIRTAANNNHKDVARLLIQNGANIVIQVHYGLGLEIAYVEGDIDRLRILVQRAVEAKLPDVQAHHGNALWGAIEHGKAAAVDLLLDSGADVNTKDERHRTALYVAASCGYEDVIRVLVEHGVDVNRWIPGHADHSYATALQAASAQGYTNVVRLLIGNGADVNWQGGCYVTALQAAAANGHEEVVRLLVEKGADVNIQGGPYGNALQAAAAQGSEETVRLLLVNGASVNATGGMYVTPLGAAESYEHRSVASLLLANGANNTASAMVAESLTEPFFWLVINRGPDINLYREEFETALETAPAGECARVLCWAAASGHLDVARLLIAGGFNVDSDFDWAVLRAAVSSCNEKMVLLLIEHGADVNLHGENGTALQVASFWGYEGMVRLLIAHGANVDAQVDARPGYCGNALHTALSNGHEGVVSLLIENGANVNAVAGSDGTALHLASVDGHRKIAQLLLENGADVHAISERYGTALEAAADHGHTSIVRLLIEGGADVNARGGGYHRTALQAAMANGYEDIARLLIENGAIVDYAWATEQTAS
ncbi:ankyrin repeat-containing domain protein [Mycena capillaripes]|nr:ankyrin repeat-containing domain protein [Mycena capillaripes]